MMKRICHRLSLPVICLGSVLALSACQTNQDPAKGGFFSGLSNLSDGTYDKRAQQKQETLENEQDVNTQKQRELERTKQQQAAVSAEKTEAEKKAAALDRDIAELKKKVAKAKGNTTELQRQITQLEARIAQVKADPVSTDSEKAARLESLRKQQDALSKELDTLIGR